MSTQMFLALLCAFSTITGLVVEVIKKIVSDKANISYNITALVTALIIGGAGTSIYYYLNDIAFTGKNIVYIVLLSFASGISSMITFDKFKQALIQCGIIKAE